MKLVDGALCVEEVKDLIREYADWFGPDRAPALAAYFGMAK